MCEDIGGGSELTAGGMFFSRNTMARPVGPSSQGETFFSRNTVARLVGPAVRWRNQYFARNKEAFSCVGPYCQPLLMAVVC